MYNIYLEEGSQYVNNVPEKQNETSDENTVLCLKYSYLFLKKKKKPNLNQIIWCCKSVFQELLLINTSEVFIHLFPGNKCSLQVYAHVYIKICPIFSTCK